MGFFEFLKSKISYACIDKHTKLMWQLDIPLETMTWSEAISYANDMNNKNYSGFNNWRLPTIEELEWVHKYKNLDIAWKYEEKGVEPKNFRKAFLWSSTTLGERIEKFGILIVSVILI